MGRGQSEVGRRGAWRGGVQGGQARLVLQEEDDSAVGHQPQLLLEALGVADLTLHSDAGKARALQVGAVCEPWVSS